MRIEQATEVIGKFSVGILEGEGILKNGSDVYKGFFLNG